MAHTSGDEWNEAYPTNAEAVAGGASEIRLLRTAVKQRLLKEHVTPAADNVGGEHKAGSAVCFIGDYSEAFPTLRPDEATNFTADDLGRLAYNTDDDNFYVLTDHDPVTWTLYPPAARFTFGAWTDKDSLNNALEVDSVYKAGSDGFVCIRSDTDAYKKIAFYTDSDSDPATKRLGAVRESWGFNMTCPIKKDDYWKADMTEGIAGYFTIYWLPIGTGTCVKQ